MTRLTQNPRPCSNHQPSTVRKNMSWRALIGLLWLLFTSHATPAAEPTRWTGIADTLFTHYTDPETASGMALTQDGAGFIWLATQGGLTRWDGYHFRRYTADPQTPGSLPDGFLLALYMDDRGRLWVGTSAGGLARYDAEHDTFAVISSADGLSDPAVAAIAGDGSGGLWLGTGAGLDHMDAYGVVQRAPHDPAHAYNLPEGAITSVLMDQSGALWVGTPHGLWRRPRGSQAAFSEVSLDTPEDSHPAISRLFEDSAERIWVGTRAHGAFVIEREAVHAVRESGTGSTLESDRVTSIAEATPREVWIGTYGDGIIAVDPQTGATRWIRHRADTPTSLYDDYVYALYRDRSGLMWVSNIESLSQYDPRDNGVFTLFGGTGRPEGISGKKTFVVAPMTDGRIWLGVNGGIDIMDPVHGRVGQLVPDATHPGRSLPKGRVQAIVPEADVVYIATQQGLYRSDRDGQHIFQVIVPGRSPAASVRDICLVGDVLWLGGDEDGLWAVDLREINKPVVRLHLTAALLGDARVASIDRGAGSTLWVGTRKSLVSVDAISGSVERVPVDPDDPTQLSGAFVASTLTDHQGRLWVASFGYGVAMLERREANGRWHFRRFTLREGLPHPGVDKLLEDRFGNIWVSTDDGIAVIDGKSFTIHALQAPQGVGIRTFFTSAGAVSAEGEIIFSGAGGLVVVQPERLTHWDYSAPVVVTDVHVGNLPLPVGPFNQATNPAAIQISPDNRRLKVEFSALDYSAPERNRYAYRLRGFDADWIPAEPRSRAATYTNVPPGNYTLQLRGSNRDGLWSRPLELAVHVLPAWYETFWFRVTAVVGGLLLIWALVQARTAFLYRRQRELQNLVAERTAELERRSLQLRESQRQLEQIAYVDPLTGLANRRLFEDEMRQRIKVITSGGGGGFSLLLIDLDGFKKINDTLGHDAGDALLKVTAQRLVGAVRESDHVARLGGDEFAVVLAQTCELLSVEIVCRRILKSITEPVPFGDTTMRVSASIGSARCPAQGTASDSLYKCADLALYEAKASGRNTWRLCWQISAPDTTTTDNSEPALSIVPVTNRNP
ncbi:MAG TPA: diguanylate cyclase [Steroidobacteraceae bacterium]